MSKINIRSRADGTVEFRLLETKPYGEVDRRRTEYVRTDAPPVAPFAVPPEMRRHLEPSLKGRVAFWVPAIRGWVGFCFVSQCEASIGPPDDYLPGPYSFPDLSRPGFEEVDRARKAGRIPLRNETPLRIEFDADGTD